MGEVYKGRDTRLDRTIAIKILPELRAAEPQFRERFEREARALSQLTHPHICTLHDVGEHGGTPFLVMEFLVGEALAARLERGPLPLKRRQPPAIRRIRRWRRAADSGRTAQIGYRSGITEFIGRRHVRHHAVSPSPSASHHRSSAALSAVEHRLARHPVGHWRLIRQRVDDRAAVRRIDARDEVPEGDRVAVAAVLEHTLQCLVPARGIAVVEFIERVAVGLTFVVVARRAEAALRIGSA